jgi:hypothetical protein
LSFVSKFVPKLSDPLRAGIRTTELLVVAVLNIGAQVILAVQNEPLLTHGTVNLAKWTAGFYVVSRGILKAIALLNPLIGEPPVGGGPAQRARRAAAVVPAAEIDAGKPKR